MERRLLLEGDDIDELLERVRAEHGQDARIVGAEQRLVGGVGGFFAKRRYEVAVALDDGHAASDDTSDDTSVDTFVDRFAPGDTFERAVTAAAASLAAPAVAPQPAPQQASHLQHLPQPAPAAPQPPAPSARRPITSLEDLMDAAAQHDGGLATAPAPAAAPQPALSPEPEPLAVFTPTAATTSMQSLVFDELMRDFANRTGDGAADDAARPPSMWVTEPVAHTATPQLTYAQQAPPVHHQPDHGVTARPAPAPAPQVVEVAAAPEQPFAAALPRVLSEAFAPPVQSPPVAAAVPSASVPSAASTAGGGRGARVPRGTSAAGPLPASVLALGLPAPEGDPRIALLDVLTGVAVAAPTELTGVHVVVGDAAAVRALAASGLRHTAADDESLLPVPSPAPGAGDGLDALRAGLPDALAYDGGAVVLVEAGPSRSQARRAARQVAAVLHAVAGLPQSPGTTVTAVVDARWDVETTREWLDALGSDGAALTDLGVHGVSESAVPLRLLGHGLQVSWLDGAPATLGAWAGPCLDRMR